MKRILFVIFCNILFLGCKVEEPKSAKKDLLSFRFEKSLNPILEADVEATVEQNEIKLNLSPAINKTALKATFTNSPLSTVLINGVAQISGLTINDFSKPLKYVIVAEDGSKIDYSLTFAKSTEKNIEFFGFEKANNPSLSEDIKGVISNNTITINVPPGTNITALKPTFSLSPGAIVRVNGVIQTKGENFHDFSKPITYEISAEDGSSLTYTINVDVAQYQKKHLNLISVTGSWLAYNDNSWERAFRVKETADFQLYEVCIWNTPNKKVSLYRFDKSFDPLKREFILGGQEWLKYRESFNILDIDIPNPSSSAYSAAFLKIFEKITKIQPANHYGIKYNGHGTSGATLFEGKIDKNNSELLLSNIKSLLGKNIDFLDWSTNCNGGSLVAVNGQYKYVDYILASDELRGGYNSEVNDFFNFASDQNIEKFFKPSLSIRESLKNMVNSDKLFWQSNKTKNDMISKKIKQSISIFDCSKFESLVNSTNLKTTQSSGDVLDYIKTNYPAQEKKFLDFRYHYVHNKEFFTWDIETNGLSVN
jgi:hypothetical protein